MCVVSAIADWGHKYGRQPWDRDQLTEFEHILKDAGELEDLTENCPCPDISKVDFLKKIEAELAAKEAAIEAIRSAQAEIARQQQIITKAYETLGYTGPGLNTGAVVTIPLVWGSALQPADGGVLLTKAEPAFSHAIYNHTTLFNEGVDETAITKTSDK